MTPPDRTPPNLTLTGPEAPDADRLQNNRRALASVLTCLLDWRRAVQDRDAAEAELHRTHTADSRAFVALIHAQNAAEAALLGLPQDLLEALLAQLDTGQPASTVPAPGTDLQDRR